MDDLPRHRCLVYTGPQTKQLARLAAAMLAHLKANYRCLCLNSPLMVDGMRAYLTAAGLNVAEEEFKRRLLLSCDQKHLQNGVFDPEYMIEQLRSACEEAVADGHVGLWATGDMAWEFGPDKDFSKLLEYERALERLFETHPMLRGVCQYHADILPAHAVNAAAISHPTLFVNETLSKLNPQYQTG